MDIGDIAAVETADDIYYMDTGMYETSGYGSVYIIDADQPAIVDTGIGTNYERIIDALARVDIDPHSLAHLLVTHAHLDHAGGAGFLIADCPNATVHTHERAGPHLSDPAQLIEGTKAAVGEQWQYYVEPNPVPESRLNTLSDGDTIDLGDRSITAVAAQDMHFIKCYFMIQLRTRYLLVTLLGFMSLRKTAFSRPHHHRNSILRRVSTMCARLRR
jgi:Uncharacterized flavoproteins